MNNMINEIAGLINQIYHSDIARYDDSFLEKSVQNRMAVHRMKDYGEYLSLLERDSDEGNAFIVSLEVNFSEFFRNQLTFVFLKQIIFPSMIEKKRHQKEKEIRIWSTACSEGQEPYSLAIVWEEIAKEMKTGVSCRIFATDINAEAVRSARKGVYNVNVLKKATFDQVRNYFSPHGETYSVNPEVKKLVNFSVFDLLSENCVCPPESIFGNFDIVICSNLLFYFRKEYRQRIIDKAGHCLAKGGYLVTGETEREILSQYKYREIFPHSGIFEKTKSKETAQVKQFSLFNDDFKEKQA